MHFIWPQPASMERLFKLGRVTVYSSFLIKVINPSTGTVNELAVLSDCSIFIMDGSLSSRDLCSALLHFGRKRLVDPGWAVYKNKIPNITCNNYNNEKKMFDECDVTLFKSILILALPPSGFRFEIVLETTWQSKG